MADASALGFDVTELFLEDAPADAPADGDGLVWKTVCRTGQWRLSPIPGGKPLVIDHKLFRDVQSAFEDGAWEHVTVPLSHKDRVDENTGYVKALKVLPDPQRKGEWILRAGMRFTDPAIRDKVTNGSIANTSVGIALTGHTRTSDGKHFPRVLKHVALTNQPWLDGLEPFGGQLAASQDHDGPLVYELDTTILHPVVSAAPAWSSEEDYRQVQRGVERALSMYRCRDGAVTGPGDGIPDGYDPDGDGDDDSGEATDTGDVPMEPLNDLGVIGLTAQNALVVPYAESVPGQMNQQGWVVPYTNGADGVEIPHPDQWRAVSQQWMAASQDADDQVLLAEWDPAKHPRWPKGTPAVGGRFMRIGELLDQVEKAGGKLDVSFLAKGADNISHVEASRGGKDTAHFDVTLKDGAKHTFDVTEGGLRDGSLVQGALKQIDQVTPPRSYGIGDARHGQPRPLIDPVLEHVLRQAEADPTMHPPVKKGRTSRTLLSQEKPGGRPLPASGVHDNTQQMWTTGGEILPVTGEVVGGTWSHDRKELHDEIVNHFLNHRTPGTHDANSKPVALFFAGGTASGKSTALKDNPDVQPPDAVTIDPDEIKKWLPEFRDAALARDKYGSTMAHEESSAIAKRLLTEAQSAGHNVIIDGTGDSGQGKFERKLTAADKVGYEVHVFMVDAPTDVAVARSVIRGQKTGRFVPTEITRATHSSVSERHHEWRTNPIVKSWQLYSTDTPKGGPKAILMADGGDGKFQVHDATRYAAMLAKAGRRASDTGKAVTGENQGRRAGDEHRLPTRAELGDLLKMRGVSAAPGELEVRTGTGHVVNVHAVSRKGRVVSPHEQVEVTVRHGVRGGGGPADGRTSTTTMPLEDLIGKTRPGGKTPADLKPLEGTAVHLRRVMGVEAPEPGAAAAAGRTGVLPGQEGQSDADLQARYERVLAVWQKAKAKQQRTKAPGARGRASRGVGAIQFTLLGIENELRKRGLPVKRDQLGRMLDARSAPDARSATQRKADTLLENQMRVLRGAFHDWKTGRAYLDKRGFYKLRPAGQTSGGGGRKAPWSDTVKALYPDSFEFHKAANSGKLPDLERSPIASGGAVRRVEPRADVTDPKFRPGVGVQFERGGRFLKGTVVGPHPNGGVLVRVGDEEMVVPRSALHMLAASITVTNPSDELVLASWDSALHPRGGRGRFIRKLLDAAGNGMVKDVGESGSVLRIGLHTGHVLHVEPVTKSRVRVIHSFQGRHVRTSVHAMADLTRDHPELRGLDGLIRSKARRATSGRHSIRRFTVARGVKQLVHHGEAVHASQGGGGDTHMADGNDGDQVDTLTLTRDEFQDAVHAAVEAEREQDRLELSRRGAEVRELRVERRIAKLQQEGHAPALLKVVEQLMLADETSEPVLTLSNEDGERPLTATMIVEELLAAIPETALTASQVDPAARADGDGGEKPEDGEAFEKRIGETWDSMHSEGRHLVG